MVVEAAGQGTVSPPQEAFQVRIGVELTPINVNYIIRGGLYTAMEQGALAYRELLQGQLDQARMSATQAAVTLFPDGPVSKLRTDGSQGHTMTPSYETPGERAQEIVAEFMDGNTRPLVTAFDEMIDMLTGVSGIYLDPLKPEFLKRTPSEIAEEERRLMDKFMHLQTNGLKWDEKVEPDVWYRDHQITTIMGRASPPDPEQGEDLNSYLEDMVQAAYATCEYAKAHLRDEDPVIVTKVDQALADVTEILTKIMEGNVEEWVKPT